MRLDYPIEDETILLKALGLQVKRYELTKLPRRNEKTKKKIHRNNQKRS